jgi:hypothetical protein
MMLRCLKARPIGELGPRQQREWASPTILYQPLERMAFDLVSLRSAIHPNHRRSPVLAVRPEGADHGRSRRQWPEMSEFAVLRLKVSLYARLERAYTVSPNPSLVFF